jgi:RNA polymerase sigma factor (sigma-70 family)
MFGMKRSDAHLVGQVLRGRKDHYAPLVERYLPAVRSVARANAGPWADADDIAQETFVDAYRTLDKLRERNKFAHWLLRIARNKARDWADADRRERQKREAAGASIPASSSESTHEEREIHALLHAELEAMPPEQREVLALFHLAGHGTREIAGMLDLSHDAVRKRLQRGREALGERMLRRMEQPQNQEECGKRAKAISGIAIAAIATWEANAATGGWAVAAGWGLGGKAVVAVAVCVTVGVVLLQREDPEVANLAVVTAPDPVEVSSATAPTTDETNKGRGTNTTAVPSPEALQNRPTGDGVVFGRVYGLDDKPTGGVTVQLSLRSFSPAMGADFVDYPPQQSDADGRFCFGGLPANGDWYFLRAVTPDLARAAFVSGLLAKDFPVDQDFLELRAVRPTTGIVIDRAGLPIVGAEVWPAYHQEKAGGGIVSNSMVPPAVTDASGCFRIEYLKPGNWFFEVRATGYAMALQDPVGSGADAGTISLAPGVALQGMLVNAGDGRPVPKAYVSARSVNRGPFLRASAETDAQGRFRFDTLAAGDWKIESGGDWYGDGLDASIQQDAQPSEIQLLAHGGGEIRGRVTGQTSDTGIEGVEVILNQMGDKKAVTEKGGYYTLSHLPAGEFSLRTSEQSIENEVPVSLSLDEVKSDINFTLVEGKRALTGRVVDGAGVTIEGVRVEAFGQIANLTPRNVVTGPDGEFQFTNIVAEDHFWVRGHKDGLISRDLVRSLGESDLHDLVLVMECPAGFSGRLLDVSGRPLARFALDARGRDVMQYTTRNATSSERGRFAFPRVLPGTYTIVAGPENGSKLDVGEVTIVAGEVKEDVELVYQGGPATAIAGRILDGESKALTGVSVFLREYHGDGVGVVSSDATGSFRFDSVEPGLYELQMNRQGYSGATVPDILAGTTDLSFVLLQAARIEGVVLSKQGVPLPEYGIKWIQGVHDTLTQYDRSDAKTVKDPEGRFTLTEVSAGEVTVAAWAEGYEPTFATMELGGGDKRTGVELHLDASAKAPSAVAKPLTSLRGLVLNAQKQPVVGAYVYIDQASHPTDRSGPARATSGPDGRFVIDDVPLGTSRVLAWHKDYAPAGAALSLSDKAVHETTITMAAGGTLEGSLTGSGTALRDAYLSIDSNVLEERFYENVYPGAKGFFSARHVAAGSTTINVHYKDRWYKFPANVVEGGTSRTDIDLQVGTSAIDGTLMIDGEPVEGEITVVLPVLGGDRERFKFNTTRSGRFFIDELPAGPVELEALCEDGGTVRQTIELVAGEDLEFAMEVQRADPVP